MPKQQFPAVYKQWLLFSIASSSAGFFSLLRRPLLASFLCRVVLCLLLFSVTSSSACFSSCHPLLAFRHVVLCLLFTSLVFMDSTSSASLDGTPAPAVPVPTLLKL